MNGFNNLSSNMNEMQNASARYADHQQKHANDIVYREPMNNEESSKAKKMSAKLALVTGGMTALFALITLGTIIGGKGMKGALLMAVLTAVLGFLTYKTISTKPQVMTGIVVFKGEHSTGKATGKNTSRTYYVSVKPDSGEMVIYKDIRISYAEYNKVSEGTHVLVAKTGVSAEACVL